jgi:hypothetical protein
MEFDFINYLLFYMKTKQLIEKKKNLTRNVCYSKYATRPILYTDTIKGIQVCRDDMWAVTTEELNKLDEIINSIKK